MTLFLWQCKNIINNSSIAQNVIIYFVEPALQLTLSVRQYVCNTIEGIVYLESYLGQTDVL